MADKKKSILDKAIDLVSNRDEKAAAAAAEAEAAKKAAAAAAKAATAKAAAAKAEMERQKKAKEMEEKRKAAQATMATMAAAREAAKPKFIAEHKISGDETLSHVALKHYGNATRPYWMVIYEANKNVIGGNPNIVRPGMVLNIPELPAELKKK